MDKYKAYGAHALSYVVSALTVVAGTNPALLPPSWLPYIGLLGLAMTAGHNAQVAGAPKPGDITTVVKSFAFLAITAVLLATLAACASWTPTQRIGAQVAVMKATGEYVKRSAHPDERAARVIAAVESIEAHVSDQSVTLAVLEAAALAEVAKVSDPLDRQLLADVVAASVNELKEYAAAGVLKDTDKVAVARVLSWVKSAALAYVPKE